MTPKQFRPINLSTKYAGLIGDFLLTNKIGCLLKILKLFSEIFFPITRQNGFAAGHSPTNYKRWSRTDTPYYVRFNVDLLQ